MYSLVMLLTMLGASPEDQQWTNPVWERGYEIWSEHKGARLSVCDILSVLQDGAASPLAQKDLFAVEATYADPIQEGTTVQLPTFSFSSVSSVLNIPTDEAAPRIIVQEEEEEKLGLTIPE